MSCKKCDEMCDIQNLVYYYRFKNANIGVLGCEQHVKELFEVLNKTLDKKGGELT